MIWNGCGHNEAVTNSCRQNVIVNTVRNSPHSVRGRVIFSQMSFCNSPNSVRGRVIFSKMSFCRPKEPLRPDRTSHVTHAAAVKQTRQLPAKNPRTAHTSRTLGFFPKENSHTCSQSVTNRSASALQLIGFVGAFWRYVDKKPFDLDQTIRSQPIRTLLIYRRTKRQH